ncbi:MAG: DsbA family protein [Planctomycetota bacterium]|jgi:2-hydroxychromene-2-carboxylate isomerase
MTAELEFFFDVASPYTHLASKRIGRVADEAGVTVRWRPFLLGGVFKATGNTMPAAVPARARFMFRDLQRWAEWDDVKFRFSSSFPHNSLHVMRALIALPEDEMIPAAHRAFDAVWVDDVNISDMEGAARALGEEGERLIAQGRDPEVKEKLKAATAEAAERGAFGAPTFLVGDELFWGNDRLEMAVKYAASA